ncbi:MAG: lysylphosphatidylglycerol synthase transmembrane domain-containing protein [Chloroflexota bacterium]
MPDVPLALLAVLPLASVELAKAGRWRVLFGHCRPSYIVALRALMAGQATNALSPIRAGEAVRLGVLTAQGGALVPGAGALAGAKAIDTVCLAAIAFGVAGASVFSRSTAGLAAGLAAGVGVMAAGLVLALTGSGLRRRLDANPVTRKLRLASLVDVARAAREPRTLGVVALATAVVWAAGLMSNALVLAAVGVPPTLDLAARIIVAGYLLNLFPSPPAQIGTFEAAVTVALTSAGVGIESALAAGVTLHVCQMAKLGLFAAVLAVVSARRLPWTRWPAPT